MRGEVRIMSPVDSHLLTSDNLHSPCDPGDAGKWGTPPSRRAGDFDYESKTWGGNEVGLSPKYLNALRLKYCLADLQDVHGRILEVGCGAGGMARAVKSYRPDLEVHGCDVSRSAIRIAKSRSGRVSYAVCDAYDLAFPEEFFDAVVMFDVLEHLESPGRAMREIFRVLRDGAIFHLFVPCEGAIGSLHGLLSRVGFKPKERYGGHIQRFDGRMVYEMLERNGFVAGEGRWSGYLLYQVADLAYFSLLQLGQGAVSTSVEGYVQANGRRMRGRLLGALKDILSCLTYYESHVLRTLHGWGLHLSCIKSPLRQS